MCIVCVPYTVCVRVRALKKKRRDRLSFDVCDGGHQTQWNRLQCMPAHDFYISEKFSPCSILPTHRALHILSNLWSWLPSFENKTTTTTKTTGSRFDIFFHVYNNQSLFGMPLSRFCNNQVPKIRNLFLESNIHFHR